MPSGACPHNPNCPCGADCRCGPGCRCVRPPRAQNGGTAGCGSCGIPAQAGGIPAQAGGGGGCGPGGCPIAPLSYREMLRFGGRGGGGLGPGVNAGQGPILTGAAAAGTTGAFVPIPGIGQNGGGGPGTGVNVRSPLAPLGTAMRPPAPMPGPFVGQPWGAQVAQWPGVNGVANDRNYLAPQAPVITNDPQLQMNPADVDAGSLTRNSMVGGGNFDDLTNVGRSIAFNLEKGYNALSGYPPPANPLPFVGQLRR